MIPKETKDYCWGLYGKSPAPIDKKVQKMVLKGYERGEEPIKCRAADMLEPELEKAKKESKEFAKNIQDTLIYALYPVTGARFLKYKYGIDKTIPDDWKAPRAPKTLEDIKKEDELIAKAKAGKLVEKVEKPVPEKGLGLRKYNVFIEDEYYEVEVEAVGGPTNITVSPPVKNVSMSSSASPAIETPTKMEEKKVVAEGAKGIKVLAPMPGMIIRYLVNAGDKIEAGDPLVILEAMKMQNTIPAPVAGTVDTINLGPGDPVKKDEILAIIS